MVANAEWTALWGVYHARGSMIGKLAYAAGKLAGTAHCALCDVTHGAVRKKSSFAELQDALPVTLHLVHLDERPEGLAAFTEGRTPCVVGERASTEGARRFTVLLDRRALEALDGSVSAFRSALHAAMAPSEAPT